MEEIRRGSPARPSDRAELITWLGRRANAIRQRDLVMLHRAGLGHPGGDLSVVDILATLYLAVLRQDTACPAHPQRDRLILSKGHAAGALYATLAEAGLLEDAELDRFAQPVSRLSGHPSRAYLPQVEAATGPLGHGLPVAVGCALAAKLDKAAWRTYVVVGDGELQEGSNWEAAMAASMFALDNLALIVDRNGLQLGDTTERTMALEPLAAKLEAFGWAVVEVDGHDHGALLAAFEGLPLQRGRPSACIAHTHKGQGVSFMRDRRAWHHRVPDAAELAAALAELKAADDNLG